ncbi:MAG TPA: cytochrome P450 [Solirubrobacterales bacterium]|jgi:cytochrome P450
MPALPPGPGAGALSQTVAFHRDPLGYLADRREEFGDVFTLRLLTMRPLVIVAEPVAVESLLDSDPTQAHAGAARRGILPFASSRSVFGGDGDAHRAARGRIAAAMAEETIDPRRAEMARITRSHVDRWPRGRPFRLLSRVRTLCDEIFVRLVLGVRDEEIATSLSEAIGRMLRTPGNPPVTLPGKGDGLVGELGQKLFEQRQAPVVEQLRRATEARRADPSDEADVLGCMVSASPALSSDEIVDELMSLLMAAQEPPSIALTWLLDRLAREPDLAQRFRTDPHSELADAVVRETLRLRPPASGVLRRLRQPIEAGQWLLPAGATVLVPSALVHRDARSFPDPNSFRVGRWLGNETPSGPYFPFGGGARRCIGEPLAHAEIETVIPAILERLSLEPLSRAPEPMVQRATVLVPKRSLLARASS